MRKIREIHFLAKQLAVWFDCVVFVETRYWNICGKEKMKRHRDNKEPGTQKQVGFIVQTANTTIRWTAATIPAINSGTHWSIWSVYRIIITKSCSWPYISVEAIYFGRKRCKHCLERTQEIHGWSCAATELHKLVLSDNSMQWECTIIAAPLKEYF